jgi:hypothetical protein
MASNASRKLQVVYSTIAGARWNSRRSKYSTIDRSTEVSNARMLRLDLPLVAWFTTLWASFIQSKYSHYEPGRNVKRDTSSVFARLELDEDMILCP